MVDASLISAEMVDCEAIGNRANRKRVGDSMSLARFAIDHKSSVSVMVNAGSPQPTKTRFIDFAPKACLHCRGYSFSNSGGRVTGEYPRRQSTSELAPRIRAQIMP